MAKRTCERMCQECAFLIGKRSRPEKGPWDHASYMVFEKRGCAKSDGHYPDGIGCSNWEPWGELESFYSKLEIEAREREMNEKEKKMRLENERLKNENESLQRKASECFTQNVYQPQENESYKATSPEEIEQRYKDFLNKGMERMRLAPKELNRALNEKKTKNMEEAVLDAGSIKVLLSDMSENELNIEDYRGKVNDHFIDCLLKEYHSIFDELKEIIYDNAVYWLDKGFINMAVPLFDLIPKYKDSKELAAKNRETYDTFLAKDAEKEYAKNPLDAFKTMKCITDIAKYIDLYNKVEASVVKVHLTKKAKVLESNDVNTINEFINTIKEFKGKYEIVDKALLELKNRIEELNRKEREEEERIEREEKRALEALKKRAKLFSKGLILLGISLVLLIIGAATMQTVIGVGIPCILLGIPGEIVSIVWIIKGSNAKKQL